VLTIRLEEKSGEPPVVPTQGAPDVEKRIRVPELDGAPLTRRRQEVSTGTEDKSIKNLTGLRKWHHGLLGEPSGFDAKDLGVAFVASCSQECPWRIESRIKSEVRDSFPAD